MKKEINLFIDESGNLGKDGRFFLICALDITEEKRKTLTRRAGRIINHFKESKAIPKNKEIKGSFLKDKERIELIRKILFHDVLVRYIVIDLKQTTMLLEKADDKNACYNYLVQLLIKQVLKDNPYLNKVNIYLDNRSVKIGNRLSLKPYLYNKLVLEQLEYSNFVHKIDFGINYFESDSCYLIQWADIISNSIFKKYNKNNDKYYKLIKPYIIFESKFPYKNFGK